MNLGTLGAREPPGLAAADAGIPLRSWLSSAHMCVWTHDYTTGKPDMGHHQAAHASTAEHHTAWRNQNTPQSQGETGTVTRKHWDEPVTWQFCFHWCPDTVARVRHIAGRPWAETRAVWLWHCPWIQRVTCTRCIYGLTGGLSAK